MSYYTDQQVQRIRDWPGMNANRQIFQSIQQAYKRAAEKGWDTLYWAIDIHDTIAEPSHELGKIGNAYPNALETMWWLLTFPETRIILWSSMSKDELARHRDEFFTNNGVVTEGRVYLNENPEVGANKYANFEQKMYFNMLLDDKAGFDPKLDWPAIVLAVKRFRIPLGQIKV